MEIISLLFGAVLFILIGSLFYPQYHEEIKIDYQDNEESKREYFSDIYAPRKTKQEHLQSEYWKQLKQQRHDLVGGNICEACGKHTDQLDLHHVTYKYLTYEKLDNVRLLCRTCHNKLHAEANKIYENGYGRENDYPLSLLIKPVDLDWSIEKLLK